uniref:Uncharacterized protein n=1 Tax=Oryza punctata TaxID=4537 RepID=A0A0E0K597_ORYPU
MKHIFKIIAMLVAVSAIWIALLETATVPRSYTWLLPIYLVVALGCYGLFMVGFGLMFFPTCPQEAVLLQQDILEAKEFLSKKGWFTIVSGAGNSRRGLLRCTGDLGRFLGRLLGAPACKSFLSGAGSQQGASRCPSKSKQQGVGVFLSAAAKRNRLRRGVEIGVLHALGGPVGQANLEHMLALVLCRSHWSILCWKYGHIKKIR